MNDPQTTLAAMAFAGLAFRPRRRSQPGEVKARGLSTEALKALWDSYDGAETADPAISGEAVYVVLNEREEGEYCAV